MKNLGFFPVAAYDVPSQPADSEQDQLVSDILAGDELARFLREAIGMKLTEKDVRSVGNACNNCSSFVAEIMYYRFLRDLPNSVHRCWRSDFQTNRSKVNVTLAVEDAILGGSLVLSRSSSG